MHIIADCSYYTLRQRLSWNEIMDDMAISSDDQPLYLKWLKENFRMGNDRRFMQRGVWFPNPLRQSKHSDRVQHSFNAGMRFPRPTGPAWTDFVAKHRPVKPFDASESEMIAELAMANIAIEVYYEWADVARMDTSAKDILFAQVSAEEMHDSLQPAMVNNKITDKYVDEKGLPIAPKSIREMLKRTDHKIWDDAIEIEQQGLDKLKIFEHDISMQELIRRDLDD